MWCTIKTDRMLRMYLCRWEKFLKAKRELKVHTSHGDGVLLLLNKGKEGGGRKGECIRGHCFRASHSECQRGRDRWVEEHPVTYQSRLFRFHLFHHFPSPVYTNCFSFNLSAFKLCIAQCECMLLLWKLERGDNEGSKLQISLFVFRLSKLSLSVFIYCTITVQFTVVLVQWNMCFPLYVLLFKHLCSPATIFLCVWNSLLYPERTDNENQFLQH